MELIKNTLINDYNLRAMTQLNLHWSFEDYFANLEKQIVLLLMVFAFIIAKTQIYNKYQGQKM